MPEVTQDEYDAIWNEDESETPVADEPASDDLPAEEPADDLPEDDEPAATAEEPDIQAQLADLQHRLQSAEGRAKAFQQHYETLRSQTQPPPGTPAPSDEDAFLEKFRKEYNDDVIRAIDLVASRRANELVTQQLSRFQPVEQNMQTVLEQLHFQTIESVHPDIYEINESPAFEAWIESRPVHLRPAYQRVREQGSPQEVISLLDEYKQASKPPKGSPSGAPRVDAATAVKPRRGGMPAKQEPGASDDWEELWRAVPD